MTTHPTPPNPRDEVQMPADCEAQHVCLPLYRAADGLPTKCWCGSDVRHEPMLRNNVVRLDWMRSLRTFKGATK